MGDLRKSNVSAFDLKNFIGRFFMLLFSIRFCFISILLYVFDNCSLGLAGFSYRFVGSLLFASIFLVGDFLITRCLGGEY